MIMLNKGAVLPDVEEVGLSGGWILPDDDGGSTVELNGKLLGVSTSHWDRHFGHPLNSFVAPGERCGSCRWFEVRIFRDTDNKQYMIHYAGRSIVPEEKTRSRYEWLNGAHAVLEALTTRRVSGVYLTPPAARVMAQAASQDKDLEEVWINRAVN
jgi:hypothetical protein